MNRPKLPLSCLLLPSLAFASFSAVAAEDSSSREERVKQVLEVPNCVAFWDFVKRENEGEADGKKRFLAHVPAGREDDAHAYALDAANYVKDYWGEGRAASYADFPLLGSGPFGDAILIRKESEPDFRPLLFVPQERLHDTPLDIKGAGTSVTVVVREIRESGNLALAGLR